MPDDLLSWDRKITKNEAKKILKDDSSARFVELAAILLSGSGDPKEVFSDYLDKLIFCRNWNRIKKQMRKNKWNDNRIIFWDTVYEVAAKDIGKEALRTKKSIAITQEVEPVGKKIREARKRLGWTQKELAKRTRISQQTISLVENGRTNISLKMLKKVTDALGLEICISERETSSVKAQTYTY